MMQMGRSVEGSCWKEVGICGVVGVWEGIRMEVSRGNLML